MAGLSHWRGSDLDTSANGNLLTLATGTDLGQQSVVRRMLSNEGDHIWFSDYGAGLPRFIGMPAEADRIRGAILKNAKRDEHINQRAKIEVTVTTDPGSGATLAKLKYTDATTGQSSVASLNVGDR